MTDIRNLLDRALPPTPPPIAITRDSAIGAGRLARRRQRARYAGVSAVAALAVVAGIAVASANPAGRTLPGATTPSSMSLGPTVSATAFPSNGPLAKNPTAATVIRLNGLTKAWAVGTLSRYTTDTSETGPALDFAIQGRDLVAATVATDAQGTGHITVILWARGSRKVTDDFNTICAPKRGVLACETRIGPHGEHIVIRRINYVARNPRIVTVSIGVSKPDGTEIVIDSTNASSDLRTTRPDPPLTVDELLDLVLDPAFTLRP